VQKGWHLLAFYDPEHEGIMATKTSVTLNISTKCNTPENLNLRHTPRLACLFVLIYHLNYVLPNLTLRKYFLDPGKALRERTNSTLRVGSCVCMPEHVWRMSEKYRKKTIYTCVWDSGLLLSDERCLPCPRVVGILFPDSNNLKYILLLYSKDWSTIWSRNFGNYLPKTKRNIPKDYKL
jgi:hypothetical protein